MASAISFLIGLNRTCLIGGDLPPISQPFITLYPAVLTYCFMKKFYLMI
jgi:hypothetical protein